MLNNGYIKIHRKITVSEIWTTKPAWWLKVFLYYVASVNYEDNASFRRGEGLFTLQGVWEACHLENDNIKPVSISNLNKWLNATTQATTRKTTRGYRLTIVNYDKYQDKDNLGTTSRTTLKSTSCRTMHAVRRLHSTQHSQLVILVLFTIHSLAHADNIPERGLT